MLPELGSRLGKMLVQEGHQAKMQAKGYMDKSGKWVYQQWCAKQHMLVPDSGNPPVDTAATQLVLANLHVAIIHIEVTLRADQLYDYAS